MKIGIVLQARMGSSRLPGKILKIIGNMSLLEHIFFRLKFLRHNATVVLATSNLPQNDIVEIFCRKNNIHCFRGSEDNVLERYYLCAKYYRFDHIVRLTADNPFPDIEEIDRLIDSHLEAGSDFANSFEALPVGVGAEIFTFDALEKSYCEGKKPHHIEHVNEYMLEHPEIFKTIILDVAENKKRPDIRLTVDTEEDYRKACYIVEQSKCKFITTEEAIRLCLEFA